MKAALILLGMATLLGGAWAEAKEILFPEMAGWKRSGQVQIFEPARLYEYIDGAADLYLTYEFEELKVAEYENDRKARVVIDLYRHKSPLYAFGIYSQERLPKAEYLQIGLEAYYERGFLNFLQGPYYVKLSSINTGGEDREVLITFAKKMASLLGPKGSFPPILSVFPGEGKERYSEKFFPKNFLGYPFFQKAFSAEYRSQGQPFRLFVMDCQDERGCNEMTKAYLQVIPHPKNDPPQGRFTVKDPHHGEIEFLWKGRYLWGGLNLKEPSLRSKHLRALEEGLKKVSPSCCK
ncbi:MAG: hypothetical protein N3G78_13850 [Desulfobacterota bacterium]|nr:hypothetical protein [Thermodesulfobacteriota bacterium]